MKKITTVSLSVVASLMLLGCGEEQAPSASSSLNTEQTEATEQQQPVVLTAERLREMSLEVRGMVPSPEADNPNQCQLVPMGHKPCGGPERYLLYSTKTLNGDEEQAFLTKLQQYNKLSRQFKQDAGMVSDCQVLPEPGVIVRQGFCVPAEKNTM